ncbi:MAG: adenylate/guanylate cyclase domain-containing protein [Boseongicola sp.]
MSEANNEVSRTLIDGVSAWLKESALKDPHLETVVTETCDRLSAVGIPLLRVHFSFSMLHPLYAALSFTWVRGKGVQMGNYQRVDKDSPPPDFAASPYYQLISKKLGHLRRRIDQSTPSEFPIFDDLKELGVTDYLAFIQSFGNEESGGIGRGMIGSWTTDRAGGFSDEMIKALLHIQSNFAVTALMAVSSQLADNMLTTYLGGNAGKRVQSGQIQRGDGETIRAALVMVDMRGSTALAENVGRQGYIETLNQFFDAVAEPFNRDGGEILSFVGDGFLAVFPCERHKAPSQIAARTAMSAARQAIARIAEMNEIRVREGQDEIGFGIGLHVGNVMFGNVGLRDRLTFSAFGSAVNEVQRLESLTKKFGKPLVASEIFKDYCGGDWEAQGEEELRGLTEKHSVFVPGPKNMAGDGTPGMKSQDDKSRSEAEEIMLLLRGTDDSKSKPQSHGVH